MIERLRIVRSDLQRFIDQPRRFRKLAALHLDYAEQVQCIKMFRIRCEYPTIQLFGARKVSRLMRCQRGSEGFRYVAFHVL